MSVPTGNFKDRAMPSEFDVLAEVEQNEQKLMQLRLEREKKKYICPHCGKDIREKKEETAASKSQPQDKKDDKQLQILTPKQIKENIINKNQSRR